MFILDEIFAYSKKKIREVEQNLDVIYGAHSEEKKNGLNQLHGHLKLRLTVILSIICVKRGLA